MRHHLRCIPSIQEAYDIHFESQGRAERINSYEKEVLEKNIDVCAIGMPSLKSIMYIFHINRGILPETTFEKMNVIHVTKRKTLLFMKLPNQSAAKYKKREDRSYLKERTYADYKAFLSENPYSPVAQMDTVYNDGSNGPFIQTFKFLSFPFFFAVYHERKTADEMVKGVDYLESILGRTLFDKNVYVLLTDREGEFFLLIVRCSISWLYCKSETLKQT